nr:hypothetical protein [Oryza sativa Japonica Group]
MQGIKKSSFRYDAFDIRIKFMIIFHYIVNLDDPNPASGYESYHTCAGYPAFPKGLDWRAL